MAGAFDSFLNRFSVREMDDHDPVIAHYADADRVWNAPVIHEAQPPNDWLRCTRQPTRSQAGDRAPIRPSAAPQYTRVSLEISVNRNKKVVHDAIVVVEQFGKVALGLETTSAIELIIRPPVALPRRLAALLREIKGVMSVSFD